MKASLLNVSTLSPGCNTHGASTENVPGGVGDNKAVLIQKSAVKAWLLVSLLYSLLDSTRMRLRCLPLAHRDHRLYILENI